MTTKGIAATLALVVFTYGASRAQAAEGHVNYAEYTNSTFDPYTQSPTSAQIQWMQSHFSEMIVFSPYFDSRTSWFPKSTVYQDLYAIYVGSSVAASHPDWILHDQYGAWLYIPWGCSNGTCPQYAANIANPAFRAWWISQAQTIIARGNYPGLFIDDVNMEFRVGDGWGNFAAPIDTNTGQQMSWTAWRSYMAGFMEQIRAALPNEQITENSLWFSAPTGTLGQDPYINRQIATASRINIERGFASDTGLTGGTGFWSAYNLFSFIDSVHASGKTVNYQENQLNTAGQEYGLASYFMISTGNDSIEDETATPDNWFNGYSVDLGSALGPRSYANGIFRRNFSNGIALMGEPNIGNQTISLPGTFKRLDGSLVTSVTIGSRQGIILQGTVAAPPPPPPPAPAPAPTPTPSPAPAPTTTGVHYVSDLTPTYVFNAWGTLQKDKTIVGNTITLNGVKYAKGLGLHAYAEQHFALLNYGFCSTLTATVGVDDEVGYGLGRVDFQVWADGLLLYDSGFMSSGAAAKRISVNLSGRKNLSMVATNGVYLATTGIDFDHSDWANAILHCSY
jgi:hypothetical protein